MQASTFFVNFNSVERKAQSVEHLHMPDLGDLGPTARESEGVGQEQEVSSRREESWPVKKDNDISCNNNNFIFRTKKKSSTPSRVRTCGQSPCEKTLLDERLFLLSLRQLFQLKVHSAFPVFELTTTSAATTAAPSSPTPEDEEVRGRTPSRV